MDMLIRDLSDQTVKELTGQAEENNRTFEEELKAIFDETAERHARRASISGPRKAR
jgi:hypothetical protein